MPDGLTLIVCGGRDYTDSHAVYRALDAVKAKSGVAKIMHGGAQGADEIAGRWADSVGVPVYIYPANWRDHGKAAGPIRNQAMADEGADGCVAFPGGRGTADMMARARAAGIPVWEPEAVRAAALMKERPNAR